MTTANIEVSPNVARAIAKEAYIYGFPSVMAYKTMHNFTLDPDHPEYRGPFNQVACEAKLLSPQDTSVVSPNADTPYCMFWLDLRAEPQVLSVPDMEPDRFYQVQLTDLYTHNFAYVGTVSTGNVAGTYLIAGPGWDGDEPEGIDGVIRSETPFVFVIVRTQLFGPDDLERVADLQQSYEVRPLSAYLDTRPPAPAAQLDFPVWEEGAQFDERSFGYLDFVLQLLEEPPAKEEPLWERLQLIGLGPHTRFEFDALPHDIREALADGVKEGLGDINRFVEKIGQDPLGSAKVVGTREFLEQSARQNYGLDNPYLLRAAAAQIGLYGNSAAEALYRLYLTDAEGQPLDTSQNQYTLTFAPGELPPVKAFWSLTIYDARTQLFVDNPLDRYLLNSTMLDQFVRDPDGSLTLYVSTDSPGPELESNWLPAPDGPCYAVLRMYGPREEALEGRWIPPMPQKSGEMKAFQGVGAH